MVVGTGCNVLPSVCENVTLSAYGNASDNKLDAEEKCPKLGESVVIGFSVARDRANVGAVYSKEIVNSRDLTSVSDGNSDRLLDESVAIET